MKLALLISTMWGGGAQRVMAALANHWAARGDDVTLVTYDRSVRDYRLDPRVQRMWLDAMSVSGGMFRAVTSNWRRIRALRRTLRTIDPAAIVVFEERMNATVMLATMGLGVRRVISERTDPRLHRIERAWSLLRRLTYPFAEALVVQTAGLRPWATRLRVDADRVHVIPNPVRPMEGFRRDPAASPDSVVLGVGRLVRGKGFDVLLRAFASIAAEYPEWHVRLVGEGPERESLTRLAVELGIASRLTITGWIDEPGTEMTRAGIYVLSSRYEGFPNALLEAMACGVPVVATTCAGADAIVTDGIDGLVVPVDAPEALSAALRRLMSSTELRDELGERARATAGRYGIERIVALWDEVIAPRGSRSASALLPNAGK